LAPCSRSSGSVAEMISWRRSAGFMAGARCLAGWIVDGTGRVYE